MHPTGPPHCGGGSERSCSSQQAAAAWAWLEHGGATCITPRRAEGLVGAHAHRRTSCAPPSRFKKECMDFLKQLPHPNPKGEATPADAGTTLPVARPRRRHSFHGGDAARHTGESLRPTSQQPAHVDDMHLLNGDEKGGSSLLDKFELESVWRQVRHLHIVSESARCTNSKSPKTEESKAYDGHRSPDTAASHNRWASFMRRGRSGYFHHNTHHTRSPSKDDHIHGRGTPHFVQQLLGLRIIKSASSPLLCSSIETANSVRDPRMPSNKVGVIRQEKPPHSHNSGIQSLVRRADELDQHHYHKHRHIHHHHHHHHHLLHHDHREDGVLLKQGHPVHHLHSDKDGGRRPQNSYHYSEKNEGRAYNKYWHPLHLDNIRGTSLSCKSAKSHHVSHKETSATPLLCKSYHVSH